MTTEGLIHDLTTRGVRLIPTDDGLTVEAPAGVLTPGDLATLRALKSDLLAALAPKPGICLDCGEGMNLQNGANDCWWCPGCRIFSHGNGRLMERPTIPKPLTHENDDARKLLADLLATGCGVYFDGHELRITNLTKVSTALWLRLENAGPVFIEEARTLAASFEERGEWVN